MPPPPTSRRWARKCGGACSIRAASAWNGRSGASGCRHEGLKKRASPRKTGRPFWRQPLLLGVIVLLLGSGGAGGWWAWHEGWLVEAHNRLEAVSRSVVAAITPFKLTDVTVEG